jgi:hypothetical protein
MTKFGRGSDESVLVHVSRAGVSATKRMKTDIDYRDLLIGTGRR